MPSLFHQCQRSTSLSSRSVKLMTCGSVDDGKSTLIGRLLFEANLIKADQLAHLKNLSKRHGTSDDQIDFSLLLDGLSAEREQSITIDVAYRFFNTSIRSFRIADVPGHEEYTKNMVTGASTAEIAILLVDASRGLSEQTRRHSFIVSLLGIRHIVLAINKIDLIDYKSDAVSKIVLEYNSMAEPLAFETIMPIPISARHGDNIIKKSLKTPWYKGTPLLQYLEEIEISRSEPDGGYVMPIQWVNRQNSDFRGFAGTIAAGSIEPGQKVVSHPSNQTTTVRQIILGSEILSSASTGEAVTVVVDNEIDLSRGDVLAASEAGIDVSDQFEADVVWMDSEFGFSGRPYWMMLGSAKINAKITKIKYKYDLNTFAKLSDTKLQCNDIASITIKLDQAVPFLPYQTNRKLGGFILVDRFNLRTVAAGMIKHSLHRAANVRQQYFDVNRAARESLSGQKGRVFWLTGLSGAGKSTIANEFEKALHKKGLSTYVLDGDNIRTGLNGDLGFTDADRIENIRRVAEVAKLMVDAGLIVITAFISPFKPERESARALFDEGDFSEVYVDAPIDIAEQRDSKGLYKKARSGEIPNFTGLFSSYEPPLEPEVHLTTSILTIEQCVAKLLDYFETLQ